MPRRSLTTRVGRYEVSGDFEGVELQDGEFGLHSMDWGRLELEAAVLVLSQATPLLGGELRYARKAMGLHVAELARLLDVSPETVSGWETSVTPIEPDAACRPALRRTHGALWLAGARSARVGGLVADDRRTLMSPVTPCNLRRTCRTRCKARA